MAVVTRGLYARVRGRTKQCIPRPRRRPSRARAWSLRRGSPMGKASHRPRFQDRGSLRDHRPRGSGQRSSRASAQGVPHLSQARAAGLAPRRGAGRAAGSIELSPSTCCRKLSAVVNPRLGYQGRSRRPRRASHRLIGAMAGFGRRSALSTGRRVAGNGSLQAASRFRYRQFDSRALVWITLEIEERLDPREPIDETRTNEMGNFDRRRRERRAAWLR